VTVAIAINYIPLTIWQEIVPVQLFSPKGYSDGDEKLFQRSSIQINFLSEAKKISKKGI